MMAEPDPQDLPLFAKSDPQDLSQSSKPGGHDFISISESKGKAMSFRQSSEKSTNEDTEEQKPFISNPDSSETNGRTTNSPKTTGRTQNLPETTGRTQNLLETTGRTQNLPKTIGRTQNLPETTGRTQNSPEITGHTQNLPETTGHTDPQIKEVEQVINKLKKRCKKLKCCVIIISAIILANLIFTLTVLIWCTFKPIEHLKDGHWSEWSNWSQCSATCGHGLQNRIRTCSDPEPSTGGKHCPGQNVEYQMCNLSTCTVPSYPYAPIVVGNWSEWSNWSQCSATCGHGLQNRTRTCSDPEPSTGGKHCPGQNVEYQMCNLTTCKGDIAAFSWKFKIQNGILTFPDRPHDNGKIYEHGNGFNPDNGVFTCSKPGIYLFSVTLVKEESNSNLRCHLYKTEPYPSSNQLISLILNSSNYSSNSFSYASATVTVELKRNDTVYISSCSASSSSSKAYSVFSGVLLHQII